MKLYLIVANGKHKGMPIEIGADLYMIGTDKMCQLRSKVGGVGDKHCALVTRGGKVFVRDLHSGYPTMLNGNVVAPGEEWPMHAGDRLAAGPLEFMIQFREKLLSQRDMEEWAAKCLDVTSDKDLFDDEADDFHKTTRASDAAASIIDKLQAQRGVVMGRLRIGRESGITTVRFNDRQLIDEGEIAMIKKELCEHLARPNLRVLLDCKNVGRMSTAAVLMISEFYKWLRPWGSTMAICRLRTELQGMLRTMDLAKIPIYHDKRTAVKERW
jgi:anti-anti-sigma regulatory factor